MDDTVTAHDVLLHQQELEQEAAEVLPYKTDTCSYSLGYLNQQVYVCLSCSTPGNPAGICFACSVSCHGDHDIAEIFVKRHFRCDCGIDGLANHPCQLKKPVDDGNPGNIYNHNFLNRYCLCDSTYNEEDGSHGVMVQCLACQDWFHQHCIYGDSLHKEIPSEDQYTDLICASCVDKLCLYPLRPISVLDPYNTMTHLPSSICLSKAVIDHPSLTQPEPAWIFLPEDWRSLICQCIRCQHWVAESNSLFLFDEEDCWTPDLDPQVHVPLYDRGMQLLDQVDRVRAIEGVQAMNHLSEELKTYLQRFADRGMVVTESDIKSFFDSLQNRK